MRFSIRCEPAAFPGHAMYLGATFIATGLALYYESFLYSPLVLPILLGLLVRSHAASPRRVAFAWAVVAVWAANAAQQIATFRGALGQ